ncbi:n-terminal domain [Trichoderma arundinaceum]|uniref:N-terminal domain n=1 Tax=Trichoderma arundinaceum TaxID=490622 RepID=A0A395NKH6_TRIAR|nr:n-terminal domain [Trichoderma arundinaceum]
MVKEMIIGEVAEYFHAAGFTVLAYDPRSIGASDGTPRNEINPLCNIEDYHDALTFLKAHPLVDPSRIAFWGYSFSGMIALCAAAQDKRAKAVVAVSPLATWNMTKRVKVLAKAMKERESLLAGNQPVYLPMLDESNENAAGFGTGYEAEDAYSFLTRAAEIEPNFVPQTTLSSFYHIATFQPLGLMHFVSPTPVMVVSPENDMVSPLESQKKLLYDCFLDPKEFLAVPNKGHFNVLSGEGSTQTLDAQITFLRHFLNK